MQNYQWLSDRVITPGTETVAGKRRGNQNRETKKENFVNFREEHSIERVQDLRAKERGEGQDRAAENRRRGEWIWVREVYMWECLVEGNDSKSQDFEKEDTESVKTWTLCKRAKGRGFGRKWCHISCGGLTFSGSDGAEGLKTFQIEPSRLSETFTDFPKLSSGVSNGMKGLFSEGRHDRWWHNSPKTQVTQF